MTEASAVAPASFPRGAVPTPRHKLQASMPYQAVAAPPASVVVIPPFLEMWLNDQYGDCVTAEEAFAKALYSVANGLAETRITDQTVMAFCQKYGFLNGANLTDVMDRMISDGFQQDAGYRNGHYLGVDYSNETVLQSAIAQGPVKIAIDANALPGGAGRASGWSAHGGSPGQFGNTDHCISICGYGLSALLFETLKAPMSAGFPTNGYLVYTWSTIGVVDHAWIMSTCVEAWLRNPTTTGITPPPPPPPTPTPGATWSITGASVPVADANVPGGAWWGHNLTVTQKAVGGAAAVSWMAVFFDLLACLAALSSRNQAALLAAVQKLIADLGLPVP